MFQQEHKSITLAHNSGHIIFIHLNTYNNLFVIIFQLLNIKSQIFLNILNYNKKNNIKK